MSYINKELFSLTEKILQVKRHLREKGGVCKTVAWVHAVQLGFRVEEDDTSIKQFMKKVNMLTYYQKIASGELSKFEAITRVRRKILEGQNWGSLEKKLACEKKVIDEIKNL